MMKFSESHRRYTKEQWDALTERQKQGRDLPEYEDNLHEEARLKITLHFDDDTTISAEAVNDGSDTDELFRQLDEELSAKRRAKESAAAEPVAESVPSNVVLFVPKPAVSSPVAIAAAAPLVWGESFRLVVDALARLFKAANGSFISGKGVVCAYGENPLTGKKLPPKILFVANDENFAPNMMAAIHELAAVPGLNTYVFPGLVKLSVGEGSRGKAGDVVCRAAIVLDFDNGDDSAMKVAARLPSPAYAMVETSPGNFQCWYILDRAYEPQEVEQVSKDLGRALGGDAVHSVDHVFRPSDVPNNPSKAKHDKGRVPAMSRLVTDHCRQEPVSIAQLEANIAELGSSSADSADLATFDWDEPGLGQHTPLDAEHAENILGGKWYPEGKRSQGVSLFVDTCREHGYTPQQIVDGMRGCVLSSRYENEGAMRQDVARLWRKHKAKKSARAPQSDTLTGFKKGLDSCTGYLGICLAQVKSEHTLWLWHDRIPLGMLGNIAGLPKRGKSQLTAYLAAMATTGGTFADGNRCPKGSVIFISCEDDVAKTVKPRLEAAGADCSKVHIYEWTTVPAGTGTLKRLHFDVREHAPNLGNMIAAIGDVVLIVIDPISAYMGKADSHKTADVRAALLPLMDLAKMRDIALVMVNHFNKAQGVKTAMERVSGSGAFVAVARWNWMVDFDPADRETDKRKRRRFVAPMGGNIGNDGEGFYFHIRGATNPEGIPTSKIAFEGGAVPLDADELMGPPKAEKRLDAAQFICGQLKDGPKPRHKVLEQGRAEGFSAETLRRAQRDVRPHGYNDEKLGGWVWELRK